MNRRGFLWTVAAALVGTAVDPRTWLRPRHVGLSMRFVRQYDVVTEQQPTRLDVLYGVAQLRPDCAVRLWN